ncbi:MAG: transporter [Candidatus Accumulibacter sp.]|nr:transporter [Accumulibacter sp.]
MRHPLFKTSRFLFSAASLAALAAFSGSSLALQPLITDDTGTQGSGRHQFEASYNRERARAGGETERTRSVPVVYTYGVTESLDLFAGIDHSSIRASGDRASGFGNTVIGAKWRFFENEAAGFSLALKPEIAIPVGARCEDDGLGTGKVSGNLTFILSQDVPFGSLHVNAGVGRDRYRHADNNATNRHLSIAPVWEVSERWKLALDAGIDWSRSGGGTVRSRFAEIGAIYSPSEDLEFAVGYIRATDDDKPKSTTHGLTLGVTWRF